MSARQTYFGKDAGDLSVEMSLKHTQYAFLAGLVRKATLDEHEEVRKKAITQLEELSIVYDTSKGTSCIRARGVPLLDKHAHRERITKSIVTSDEIYVLLENESRNVRLVYVCGLDGGATEGLSVHPFTLVPNQEAVRQHP